MGHHHKHAHAGTFVLLHIIAMVLLLLAISVFNYIPWYQIHVALGVKFFFSGKQNCQQLDNNKLVCTSMDQVDNKTELDNVLIDSYFLAMGGLICSGIIVGAMVVQYVLNKCLPKFIKKLLRLFVILATVISVILDALAFGLFFRVTSAIKNDGGLKVFFCLGPSSSPCTNFKGKTSFVEWGPTTGFWLVLAATIVTMIACFMSVSGGKRFKYTRLN
eukprot:Phypoly_transcript_17196.p1 GENE.Phypoly_transcript_17196~~Phypoly_transcript_17196.p1  ORF type:complete len:217 (+),score=19.84 Phypoly_transcript_17196:45-695(+)